MNRKTLGLIIVSSAVVIIGWLLLSAIGNASLTIKAPATTPGDVDVSVSISRDGEVEEEFTLSPGGSRKLRLDKGMVQVDGTAGNLKGVDVVEIGKTEELLTPAGQQHAVSKLGSNAVFCPVALADKVFSYSCHLDGRVVQHTSPTQSRTIFNEQVFAELQPLKNGLLGFYPAKFTELQYLDLPSETVQRVQLPAEVQTELDKEFPQIVVPSDPGASYFALVFSTANKIFLLDDITDTSPVEITPDFDLQQEGRLVTPSFSNREFILYAGNSQSHSDGTAEETTGEVDTLSSTIFEYSQGGKLTKTIPLPKEFEASVGVYRLTNNYYEAEQNASIVFYYLEGDTLKQIYQIYDISNWVNLDNTVYLQAEGTVYQFVPTERGLFGLHSMFSSTELGVSEVFPSVRGLLFTAFVSGSTANLLNIYQLLDEVADPSTPITASEETDTRFLGFESFVTYGVSADQVQSLKEALKEYIDTSGSPVELATALNIFIQAPARDSTGGVDTATFDLQMDDSLYKAKMEYANLTDMRLYLYSEDGAVVFDSGAY